MKPILTLVAPILLVSGSVHGALLIEETFDYTASNSLAGNSGGTGFTGSWANGGTDRGNPGVVSPGLDWGDLDVSGNTAGGGGWSAGFRDLGSTTALESAGLMDNGSTLWFSVIFDLEGQNVANADLNFALGAGVFGGTGGRDFGNRQNLGGGEGIGISHNRGRIVGAYWQDTNSNPTFAERTTRDTSLSINGTAGTSRALIAGKIEWGASNELLTLYAPDASLNLGAPILDSWSIPNLDQAQFDRLALQFKDRPQMDEIRFGATSADVLPSSVVVIP
ncbi:MAG: hypothetical protein AB8D78_00435, partial [Akkermansiaceae bacterium]